MVKVKHKPPSRVRYESAHPTVTCRVSRELYARLQEVREKYGQSFADILKVGLGVQDAAAEASYNDGLRVGYENGRHEALRLVKLGRCARCGKPITWDLNNEAQLARLQSYLPEHGLVHKSCGES